MSCMAYCMRYERLAIVHVQCTLIRIANLHDSIKVHAVFRYVAMRLSIINIGISSQLCSYMLPICKFANYITSYVLYLWVAIIFALCI